MTPLICALLTGLSMAGQPSIAVTAADGGADASAATSVAPAPTAAGQASRAPRPADLPNDVPTTHWAAQVVLRALRQSIITVEPGGRFAGEHSARRSELVHGLAKVLEMRQVRLAAAPATAVPRDVAPGDPDREAAARLIHAGLISAYHGQLRGREVLSREEMALATSRAIALIKHDGNAPVETPVDINDVAPDIPLNTAVQRCIHYKMIALKENKFFSYLSISRYQLAAILIRILDLK